MKKYNLTKRILSLVLSLLMLIGLVPMSVFAADEKPSYVALGDSISTGYGLQGYTVGVVPADSFSYLLADGLGYSLTNLAVDGNTATGVMAQLQAENVQTAVKNARLITLTVGGNDLMALFYQAIANQYNATQTNEADKIAPKDVVTIMSDSSDGRRMAILNYAMGLLNPTSNIYLINTEEFSNAVTAFSNALKQVTAAIKALNPDAEIIVTTQYNPYVEFNGASFTFFMPVDLTPIYQGMEAGVTELNKAIKDNAAEGEYIVADVKAAFDIAHCADNDLYVADPDTLEFDFHPNAAGHSVLADTVSAVIPQEPTLLETPETPTLVYDSSWHEFYAEWQNVAGAYGYEYELYEDDSEIPVISDIEMLYDESDDFEIYLDYTANGGSTYKFRVKALGDSADGFTDSGWSEFAVYKFMYFDPIVVGNTLMQYGDKIEIDADSFAVFEESEGNAVLRLVNFELSAESREDVAFLPEKGYESMDSYGSRRDAMINTNLDNLTVVLEGTNSITCGVDNFAMIQSSGNITITSADNGTLSLYTDEINVTGIYADAVEIETCRMEITSTALAISAGEIDFDRCDVTMLRTTDSGGVLPDSYGFIADIELLGCIAVAGETQDNTEIFEKPKGYYRYMKVFVPDVIFDAPKNISANNTTVTWDAVEGATNGYEVQMCVKYSGEDTYYVMADDIVTTNECVFNYTLDAGCEYYYRVRTLGDGSASGSSEWAESEVYSIGNFFIGGVEVKNKQYLYNDGTLSYTAPENENMGYAYYQEGDTDKLILSNFEFTTTEEYMDEYWEIIICPNSLDVYLIGNNTINTPSNSDLSLFYFYAEESSGGGALPGIGAESVLPDVTFNISGEKNSTLTSNTEALAEYWANRLDVIINDNVTVNIGAVYANTLTVNGNLFVESGYIYIYEKLIRGEKGYISITYDSEFGGALEFYYGEIAPEDYKIENYLVLNGGEIVDENGNAVSDGVYTVEYDDDTCIYIISFYDASLSALEYTEDNALKKLVLRSKEPEIPTANVDVTYRSYMGTASGEGVYNQGDTVTLTATPVSDYTEFRYWLDNSVELPDEPNEAQLRKAVVSEDSTYTFTAQEDVSFTAVFSYKNYITISRVAYEKEEDIFKVGEENGVPIDDEYIEIRIGPEPVSVTDVEKYAAVDEILYELRGFFMHNYNEEEGKDEFIELKELNAPASPLYNSAEYWEWLGKYELFVTAAYLPHTHNLTEKHDAEGHWKECDCSYKTETQEHSFESAEDTTCDCGFTRTVSITAEDKTVTYTPKGFDVSDMFTVDKNAGEATYTVEGGGTGEGTLSGTQLTVTKSGTFNIKVTTAPKGDYLAGKAEAVLTVEKATPDVPDCPTMFYIDSNTPVSTINLPQGFTWTDPDYSLETNSGTTSVLYTPNDTDNYDAVSIKVTINMVIPLDLGINTDKEVRIASGGEELSAIVSVVFGESDKFPTADTKLIEEFLRNKYKSGTYGVAFADISVYKTEGSEKVFYKNLDTPLGFKIDIDNGKKITDMLRVHEGALEEFSWIADEKMPIEDLQAKAENNSVLAFSCKFSTYAIVYAIEETEDKGILGDVNGDGKVNIKDATQIQKATAKLVELTDAENLRADVNADTKVNIKDATAIQKFVAKIETGLPIGGKIA